MNVTGTILKELRIKNNLTLEHLATEINEKFNVNLTRSMLSKWETGKAAPVYDHLKRLASYYEVTTDFLLGFDHYENLIVNNCDDTLDTNKKRIHNSKKHRAMETVTQLLESDRITTKDVWFLKGIIDLIISGKSKNLS